MCRLVQYVSADMYIILHILPGLETCVSIKFRQDEWIARVYIDVLEQSLPNPLRARLTRDMEWYAITSIVTNLVS